MANLSSIWNTVKEIDLRPLREEAEDMVYITLVGAAGSGRRVLARQMRRDPAREGMETYSPIQILDLEQGKESTGADLVVILVRPDVPDFKQEEALAHQLVDSGHEVLVFVNQAGIPEEKKAPGRGVNWGQKRVLYGSVEDTGFLVNVFAPAVVDLLVGRLLPLGRHFPLFRKTIAHHLINETSFSNAAYSLSTGLAEIIPAIGVPLNVADMVVLSKAQAFLVYKLGLSLGLSTEWRHYVTEFGGVLGSGFLWRQLARSLVGLIPAWGIVPKVAVAYAGTYVVGQAVLQWYLTGRHISRKQMNDLYRQALTRGKNVATTLAQRMPRPRLRKRKAAALPASTQDQICQKCGRSNATEARFCQFCGNPLNSASEVHQGE